MQRDFAIAHHPNTSTIRSQPLRQQTWDVWKGLGVGQPTQARHVKVVAPNLVDPREQRLYLVEGVQKPSIERVRGATREHGDQQLASYSDCDARYICLVACAGIRAISDNQFKAVIDESAQRRQRSNNLMS